MRNSNQLDHNDTRWALLKSLKMLNVLLLRETTLEESAKNEALEVKGLLENSDLLSDSQLVDYLTQANIDLEQSYKAQGRI